jgi:hypothetical protein
MTEDNHPGSRRPVSGSAGRARSDRPRAEGGHAETDQAGQTGQAGAATGSGDPTPSTEPTPVTERPVNGSRSRRADPGDPTVSVPGSPVAGSPSSLSVPLTRHPLTGQRLTRHPLIGHTSAAPSTGPVPLGEPAPSTGPVPLGEPAPRTDPVPLGVPTPLTGAGPQHVAPEPAPPLRPLASAEGGGPTGDEPPRTDQAGRPFPQPRPLEAGRMVSPSQGPTTQPTPTFRPYDPRSPGGSDPDPRVEGEDVGDPQAGPSLVRPYARTGGRTKPARHLDLEALVRTTVSGRDAWHSPLLTPEHTSVIELCSGTVSVAEIAARLAVPLGVARVIIADMVDLGLVEVMQTSATNGDERDPAFLRRVLSGLQRL